MKRFTLLAISLLLVSSSGTAPAHAQSVGDRVRVTETRPRIAVTYVFVRSRLRFSGRATDIGTVARINADTLFLASEEDADTLVVPTKWITQLDVSHGTKSHLLAGIGYGSLIGLGTGWLVARIELASVGRPHSEGEQLDQAITALASWAAVFVSGAVVGGIVGANSRSERWESVPQDRWHFSLAPQAHNRVGLGVSIPF